MLIQEGVKLDSDTIAFEIGLRALLIQEGVKRHGACNHNRHGLRALLIQEGVKPVTGVVGGITV